MLSQFQDNADSPRTDPTDEARASALAQLFDAVRQQLLPAESNELFHLGLDDSPLFAAGALAASSEGRLVLTRDCRRAAMRLLTR